MWLWCGAGGGEGVEVTTAAEKGVMWRCALVVRVIKVVFDDVNDDGNNANNNISKFLSSS